MDIIALHINGQLVQVPDGTTVLEAAQSVDIHIPTLCTVPGMKSSGFCRMCVVEVEGFSRLLPACVLEAKNGMVVKTHTPRIIQSRRMGLEMLLAQHPMRCLTCYRNGKCQLQTLAREYGTQSERFSRRDALEDNRRRIDEQSPAITHDPNMCILCGLCIEVCRRIQKVDVIDFAYKGFERTVQASFGQSLNEVECITCGQCIQVCPVNALYETGEVPQLRAALRDPETHVVAILSPMVGVSIGEEFGEVPGTPLDRQLITILKTCGCERVFTSAVGVDVVLLEEAYQLLTRVKSNKGLPMLSSSSPAWVKYIEHFYPDMLPLLSSCKSPVQTLATLIKTDYAARQKLDPEQVFVVSITPCTAEKFERTRPEMNISGYSTIDACVTTKEIAGFIRGMTGEALLTADPQSYDPPYDNASGAGMLFCAPGGMAEGVLRTFYELFTEKKLKHPEFSSLREPEGLQEIALKMGKQTIHAAIVNGTGNFSRLVENIAKEKKRFHYVEIKGCPGGCAHGGGQPIPTDESLFRARVHALYERDAAQEIRKAHENPLLKKIYERTLKKPAGPDAKKLIHTKFTKRERYL